MIFFFAFIQYLGGLLSYHKRFFFFVRISLCKRHALIKAFLITSFFCYVLVVLLSCQPERKVNKHQHSTILRYHQFIIRSCFTFEPESTFVQMRDYSTSNLDRGVARIFEEVRTIFQIPSPHHLRIRSCFLSLFGSNSK